MRPKTAPLALTLALTTALTAALLAAGPAGAANPRHTPPPPPTPGGPTPPQEPDVAGPFNIDGLKTTVRPDGGTHDGVEVTFDRTSRAADGGKPAPARQFVFLFDRSLRFAPEKFPACDRATFEAGGPDACPAGSRVGEGRAVLHPDRSAEVTVFNTRYADGSRGMLITLPGEGAVLENTFERVASPYREKYRWASDEVLPSSLPPLDRASTTRFTVTFGAVARREGRTHSFVTTSAPEGTPLRFGLWSHFVTGQVALPTARGERPAPRLWESRR
jgi:hypothetical protein